MTDARETPAEDAAAEAARSRVPSPAVIDALLVVIMAIAATVGAALWFASIGAGLLGLAVVCLIVLVLLRLGE